MKKLILGAAAVCVLLPTLGLAQRDTRGSVLLMPEFDNRSGVRTMHTVTNTNPTTAVELEWRYIEKDNCLEFNRRHIIGPNDTLTLITNAHNPDQDQGYVYIFARDDQGPISFNWLIGSCQMLNGLTQLEYCVEPFVFEARAPEGIHTDYDTDGVLDLNNLEYTQAPAKLFFPRFLADQFYLNESKLILINLTGAKEFTASVDIIIHNDNGELYSASHNVYCWSKTSLLDISGVFDQLFLTNFTYHNPNEIYGLSSNEAGAFTVQGHEAVSSYLTIEDPAVLAVLVEDDLSASSAVLPFALGTNWKGGLLHYQIPVEPVVFCPGLHCPCHNEAPFNARKGCENQTGDGAWLQPGGLARVNSDTFTLEVRHATPNEIGIFIQNNHTTWPVFAYDGVLCLPVDSHLVRHYDPPTIQPTVLDATGAGVNAQPFTQSDFLHDTYPGAVVYYQFWYRDGSGPCGHGANLSSGMAVTWGP